MKTSIKLDNLLKEAFNLSNAKTKREVIEQALEEFIKNKKGRNLLDLYGKIDFREDYDYKSMRS